MADRTHFTVRKSLSDVTSNNMDPYNTDKDKKAPNG